jgi:protein-S-isoprenylcysteine O-methyltransferase Ste14
VEAFHFLDWFCPAFFTSAAAIGLMRTILHRAISFAVLCTERFLLSFVFFCLAWGELNKIRNILSLRLGSQIGLYVGAANHVILFFVGALTCLLLLLARHPVAGPRSFNSVFIPLAATFFPLFYFVTQWLPAPLQANLCPRVLQMPVLIFGTTCIIVGPIIALWGLLYLGRSFGVFVSVRKTVLRGPYRWVRHPMYVGWVCSFAGIALTNFSAAYFLVVGIHILIIIYRAHLEEVQLSEHSPEYREHMKHSGFFFPKFARAVGVQEV